MHCCLSVSLLALSFHLSILLSSVCLCLRNCLSSLSKCVTKSTSLRFVLCVVCDAACGYVPVLDTSGVFSVRGTAVRPKCSPLPLACLPPTHTRPPHNWQKGHFREPVSYVCVSCLHTPHAMPTFAHPSCRALLHVRAPKCVVRRALVLVPQTCSTPFGIRILEGSRARSRKRSKRKNQTVDGFSADMRRVPRTRMHRHAGTLWYTPRPSPQRFIYFAIDGK